MASIEFDQTDERHELRRFPLWPWIELVPVVSYTTTAPGVSTLTMVEDLTARIVPGCAIRFTLIGVPYYAVCTAIAANLLTIAGAPFTLGAGDVDGLWFSTEPGMVQQWELFVQGNFGDGADATLLESDMEVFFDWNQRQAYAVQIRIRADAVDSGANQDRINLRTGAAGNPVCTANGNAGRALAAGVWTSSVTDINTANYVLNRDDRWELSVDGNGTNGDSADLSVSIVVVFE